MRYLSEDEATRMEGLGYVGELYEDLDGHLYGWVEGVDEWGDPIGDWQGLSQTEVPPLGGLGTLYAAPDGTLYQVQGLSAEEEEGAAAEAAEPEQSGESEASEGMGPGPRLRPRTRARHRRPGLPSQRPGPGVRGGPPRKRKGGFLRKLLPIAKLASRFIPIPGAGAIVRGGLTLASKLGKRKGVAGYGGLGALYAAPDGTVYRVQGLAEEDLDGLNADEELRGVAEDEELRGFAEDEELRGLDQDEELRGVAADEELRGLAQDEELRGLEGYVREDAVSGLEAYVPAEPAKTHWFAEPAEPPEIWKPLW
jgi:hypothetical protein